MDFSQPVKKREYVIGSEEQMVMVRQDAPSDAIFGVIISGNPLQSISKGSHSFGARSDVGLMLIASGAHEIMEIEPSPMGRSVPGSTMHPSPFD